MSWEESLAAMLDDLEQRAEGLYAAEREAELTDRSLAEYREVGLAGRLRASADQEVVLDVRGVGPVAGVLSRVGPDWCLVAAERQHWVVVLAAVTRVRGASSRAVPDAATSPLDRLGLTSALRRLVQAGERCLLRTVDGEAHEALLRRVGADFVEAVPWSRPREAAYLVPLPVLAAVQEPDAPR